MTRRKLPLGVQTFAKIRSDEYYYVDKTSLAHLLINEGTHYFLSRPRRFGKSLFLDTLKELFEGNEALFKGLDIHDQWDWSVKYPVLRFSFGSGNYRSAGSLEAELDKQLLHLEQKFNITPQFDHAGGRFTDLLVQLNKQWQLPVVVLVDEYDKPMLDAINTPDLARENRDFLSGFYGTVKDNDALVRFSFFTGVSKFSKVNIFSGLNNLTDITLDKRYSTLCGYTNHDIDTVFESELFGLDREQLQEWYNGYNWLGEGVYNPYDVLKLFDTREFDNYWFETGTPTFLIDLLFQRQVSSIKLDSMLSSSAMLSSFDVNHITHEALLFQSGYLTIHEVKKVGSQTYYRLGYPNKEVYQSLNESLLSQLVQDQSAQVEQGFKLFSLLQANDLAGLKDLFHAFYASIPYNWYSNNNIQQYEGYYASVFYSYFAALGLDITVEDATNHGRIDMTLKFQQRVYIFEFKVVELVPDGSALQQIKDKAYAEKYRELGQQMYLIGVEFSKEDRNIVAFEVEEA
ncbi:ATP-binding protein [Leucothrix pacifica]|uniref:AAA-ATPase-like domain-containing protein n=1 Tax=Leucothrix pacifica TaxID=1247513 RepID=A0A317C0W4_9GAMM|nr:ATP-binding protein [Leucothrix pacifica]PWQ92198.1 hypothetical protein DKW60_22295 [Leucothrix pacifica]